MSSSENRPAVLAPFGDSLAKDKRKASELLLLEPSSFLGKFQNGTAKRVVKYATEAVEAESRAEELAIEETDKVIEVTKREDEDVTDAIKNGVVVHVETVATFTKASMTAEEKARFALRQSQLARHLRTESDFSFLSVITDEERASLTKLRHQRRAAMELPRKERNAAIGAAIKGYSDLRKTIIDRIAANPEQTDAALAS